MGIRRFAALIVSSAALAACGQAEPAPVVPPPAPIATATVTSVAPPPPPPPTAAPPPPPAAEAIAATPPGEPASAFRYICGIDVSHGTESATLFLGVKITGEDLAIGLANTAAGPFELDKSKPFKFVIEGKDLKDPDLKVMLKDQHLDSAPIAKITVYGFGAGGMVSLGVEVVTDRAGKEIAKLGWRMKPALAAKCVKPLSP